MSQQPADVAELEAGFQAQMMKTVKTAMLECGYHPIRFLQMLQDHGGVEAATRLLEGTDISYGLHQLWECRRLDISLEATVLRPEYYPLFSDSQREEARRRLAELGYRAAWDA